MLGQPWRYAWRRWLVSRCFSIPRPPPPRSTLFPYTTLFRSNIRAPIQDLSRRERHKAENGAGERGLAAAAFARDGGDGHRSEEHTSELQSHHDLVCRLLLEKKNSTPPTNIVDFCPCVCIPQS